MFFPPFAGRKEAQKRGRAKGRRKETKKEELRPTHGDAAAADEKVLAVGPGVVGPRKQNLTLSSPVLHIDHPKPLSLCVLPRMVLSPSPPTCSKAPVTPQRCRHSLPWPLTPERPVLPISLPLSCVASRRAGPRLARSVVSHGLQGHFNAACSPVFLKSASGVSRWKRRCGCVLTVAASCHESLHLGEFLAQS